MRRSASMHLDERSPCDRRVPLSRRRLAEGQPRLGPKVVLTHRRQGYPQPLSYYETHLGRISSRFQDGLKPARKIETKAGTTSSRLNSVFLFPPKISWIWT